MNSSNYRGGDVLTGQPSTIPGLPSLSPKELKETAPENLSRTTFTTIFPSLVQKFIPGFLSKKQKKKRRAPLPKNVVVHNDTQEIVKNVDVFEFKTGGAFAKNIRDDVRGFGYTSWSRKIVNPNNPFFKIRKQRRNDLYVLLTPADLGFQQDPMVWELRHQEHLREYSKRETPGYELQVCPDDIGLYLLKRFVLEKREIIFPIMEPICDDSGETASYTCFVVEAKKPGCEQTLSTLNPLYGNVPTHIDNARLPLNAKLLYRFMPIRAAKGKKLPKTKLHGKVIRVKLKLNKVTA